MKLPCKQNEAELSIWFQTTTATFIRSKFIILMEKKLAFGDLNKISDCFLKSVGVYHKIAQKMNTNLFSLKNKIEAHLICRKISRHFEASINVALAKL